MPRSSLAKLVGLHQVALLKKKDNQQEKRFLLSERSKEPNYSQYPFVLAVDLGVQSPEKESKIAVTMAKEMISFDTLLVVWGF